MRIDADVNAGRVFDAGYCDKVVDRRATDANGDGMVRDEVHLSSDQSAVKTLETRVSQIADVRTDKVDALRQQIADGTYRVDFEGVADAMLRDPMVTGQRW